MLGWPTDVDYQIANCPNCSCAEQRPPRRASSWSLPRCGRSQAGVSASLLAVVATGLICSNAHKPPKWYRAWALLPWRHMPRAPPTPPDSALMRFGMKLSNRPNDAILRSMGLRRRCVFGIHNSLFETPRAPVLRAIAVLSPVAVQRDHGSRRGAGVAIGLVFDEANPAFRLSIVPSSPATVSRLQRSSTCGLRATISQPPHCGG